METYTDGDLIKVVSIGRLLFNSYSIVLQMGDNTMASVEIMVVSRRKQDIIEIIMIVKDEVVVGRLRRKRGFCVATFLLIKLSRTLNHLKDKI